MSRIGIAIWNFAGDTLGDKLRRFAEMGYTAASINNSSLDHLSDEEAAEAGRVADEYDLVLTFHGGFTDKSLDPQVAVGRAERVARWHERMGRVVCTSYDVPRIPVPGCCSRKDPDQILGMLEYVLSIMKGTGVKVLIEDCPIYPHDTERLAGWTDRYAHLGVLIDLGHMNLRLREPRHDPQPLTPGGIEAYLKGIPWEIGEVHVHSNDGTKDQHAPPYVPNADMVTAARVLNELGFSGISTIELVPAWCGLLEEEIDDACRRSLEYWRDLL